MAEQTQPRGIISREAFDAVIFDLDGVVTSTATLHYAAWKKLFDSFLRQRAAASGEAFVPFREEDYRRYVDGKPRADGVRSFLAARGITLSSGAEDEPGGRETVMSLGDRKNEYFQAELEQGPEVFASSIRLIRELRRHGFKVGLVSSSRNTTPIVEAAGIADCFDIRVDGIDMANIHLRGKPAPDSFLLAAEELGADPARTVVVEDALAGVEAGRRGGFGLVIGMAGKGDPEPLRRAGAHIVVADLAEIDVGRMRLPETRSTAALPSALISFAAIIDLLGDRKPAVFLDYDGTLTPIVSHPREAILPAKTRQAIRRLARQTTVAVVSGRDLADIRQMVGIEGVYYAGSHGFDIAGPDAGKAVFQKGLEYLPALGAAAEELGKKIAGLAGVWLERKKFALAIHFREAEESMAARLPALVEEVIAGHPGLRRSGGKKIIELRPALDWDKGRAISWLLQRLNLDHSHVMPFYLGDDLTDEDAFRELQAYGIGIVVRNEERPTAARYALDDPGQAEEFLERLAGWLEQRK
jgi:trehalose-phosphatase